MKPIDKIMSQLYDGDPDEGFNFINKREWIKPDALDTKLYEYIKPHSTHYFSPLRHLYLSEIKELGPLSYFSHCLARDGLLSVLNFFYRFPKPQGIKTILILDKKFSSLVPEAWINQVAWYRIVKKQPGLHKTSPISIYLSAILDQDQCDLLFLEQQLLQIKEKYRGLPVVCNFFKPNLLGEECAESDSGYYFQFVTKTKEVLGDKISYSNWRETLTQNLTQVLFLDLNQYKFHYSDSFVAYHFFSKGAAPVADHEYVSMEDPSHLVPLSPWHGAEISWGRDQTCANFSKKIWGEVESVKHFAFAEEQSLKRQSNYYDEVHLCSPSFKSFARSLCTRMPS